MGPFAFLESHSMDTNPAAQAAVKAAERAARVARTRAFYAGFATPTPEGITEAQREAREAFDLDAAFDALPKAEADATRATARASGRLRADLKSTIPEDLLRDYAANVLQARRMSAQYLHALRVVLGNQAAAERRGYALELNLRVTFAPERVMRTIINQMRAAGLTSSRLALLGPGRAQVVQRYAPPPRRKGTAEAELEFLYRKAEAEDETRRPGPRPGAQAETLDRFADLTMPF